MSRRAILLAAAIALLTAAPVQALAPTVAVGIGDQKPGMFTDPLFTELGVQDARLVVPWDVLTVGWQRDEVDEWMQAARDSGTRVLVTFSHSRQEGRRRVLPTPERFKYEFLRFRHRYRWADTYATWNEANHCGEPTCHRPRLVAAYYRKLRSACSRCTILPAELLDTPNMVPYARALRRSLNVEPKVWGLHNYIDANRMSTARTRALLAAVRGELWLTETGGIVKRRQRRKETIGFREGAEHAARVTRFVLGTLTGISPRITRVYLYHWDTNTSGPKDSWDSALIGPKGPRPAFAVLERLLARQRAVIAAAQN